MTQVLISFDGQQWPFDTENVTLAQAFVIKDTTKDDQFPAGRNLAAWEIGCKAAEPGCVRGLYWLMLQQAGQQRPCATLEFPVIRFHRAWAEATALAEDDPETAAQMVTVLEGQLKILRVTAARVKPAEPEPVPTQPGVPPSPGQPSPPTTTPPPPGSTPDPAGPPG